MLDRQYRRDISRIVDEQQSAADTVTAMLERTGTARPAWSRWTRPDQRGQRSRTATTTLAS
jgi:hypothetical protein